MLEGWKEQTMFELNNIMLAVRSFFHSQVSPPLILNIMKQATLLGTIIASALAWPVAIAWSVRALWLTALLFALISLSLAAQQSIALKRVVCAQFAAEKLKYLLGEPCATCIPSTLTPAGSNGGSGDEEKGVPRVVAENHDGQGQGQREQWRPLKLQLYIWQIPSMLLGNSILLFVVGLAVWVFATARAAGWGDEGKIAVVFGAFILFVAANYFLSWGGIEGRVRIGIEEVERKCVGSQLEGFVKDQTTAG